MRLLVLSFTAVSGPQLIKADKPRSIIYAVIVHEVYFALSGAGYGAGEAGCPISTSGTLDALDFGGQAELRRLDVGIPHNRSHHAT